MDATRGLVEAQSFSRRRLVAALVSGAPGGREVESPSAVRPLLAALALSVLLVAGVAARDALAGPATAGSSTCTPRAR